MCTHIIACDDSLSHTGSRFALKSVAHLKTCVSLSCRCTWTWPRMTISGARERTLWVCASCTAPVPLVTMTFFFCLTHWSDFRFSQFYLSLLSSYWQFHLSFLFFLCFTCRFDFYISSSTCVRSILVLVTILLLLFHSSLRFSIFLWTCIFCVRFYSCTNLFSFLFHFSMPSMYSHCFTHWCDARTFTA